MSRHRTSNVTHFQVKIIRSSIHLEAAASHLYLSILQSRNSDRRARLAYVMSVTFFIPIILAHVWASYVCVCGCMHVHTRNSLHGEVCAEGGGQPKGRESERERERKKRRS